MGYFHHKKFLCLLIYQGGTRGRKKKNLEREEKEKIDEEKEKPYACEGKYEY